MEKKHLDNLDLLRGIAALAVVLFHYSNSTLPTIKPNPLGHLFSWGNLGVQVFFVISGFVIPFAMYQGGYTIANAGRFIAKRMVRLGPPSWLAMVLIVAIYYAALWKNGKPIEGMDWPGMNIESVLGNMFYTFEIGNIKPFYSVLWTLEAELQYYLIIAFVFPLLVNTKFTKAHYTILLSILASSYFLHLGHLIFFKFNSLFVMGILAFLYMIHRIDLKFFIIGGLATVLVCSYQLDIPSAIAGGLTMFAIIFMKTTNRFAKFLGGISYSLYITHHFSGITAEFAAKWWFGGSYDSTGKIGMLFLFAAIAIGFAFLFYKLVEQPFIRLAGLIRFKKENK
ncbi:MAG: acyltransferase family protein [Bacteroidota bacterium]